MTDTVVERPTRPARCTSCGAHIEWAQTRQSRSIPLDVETGPNPNVIVDENNVAHIVKAGYGDRTTHFVTCADADVHRRRKR